MLGSKYGEIVGPYRGYKSSVNPNIPIEFSTAAYRIGHALIVDNYPMIDHYGFAYQTFKLSDVFFHPGFITAKRLEDIMRGLSVNLMKQRS